MRVLITGGAGFIGSHLWDALEPEGHEVSGFDNFLTGSLDNGLNVTELDITDRLALYDLANRLQPEVVIHCAASYSDPDKWHRDTQTNVEGCINAALVAKHHKARLIYFQTILPPVSSYAISKLAGEQYLRLSGVPLTVFRLANIYGPRNMSGPVPVFYKRLTSGQPCTIVDTARDMLHVHDLVRAVTDAVEGETVGTFDLCSGIQTPIREIFKTVAACLNIEQHPPIIPPSSDDVQGTVHRDHWPANWAPRIGLPTGVAMTVASYAQNGVGETHTHLRMRG